MYVYILTYKLVSVRLLTNVIGNCHIYWLDNPLIAIR